MDPVIGCVHEMAALRLKQDVFGFCAAGPGAHAFADSVGSRHWHRLQNFHFARCLHHRADKP